VPSSVIRAPAAERRGMATGGSDDLHMQGELRVLLARGRRELSARFHSSPPRTIRAGQLLATSAAPRDAIYHIRAGWACQFRDLANGRKTILDMYLPGDVVGLDAVLQTRRLEEVVTLTSVTAEVIHEENALIVLMACRPTALYIAWLLGHRQRRADRLLSAILCLDALGRVATMLLDFYTRLRRRRLITGLTYNLPLTQVQMGRYVGLTTVHVNRVLGTLRDERIVQVEKHCVTILALDQLKRLAQQEQVENSVVHVVGRPFNEIVLSGSEAAE
jgi:CRP/FNR family transcriptional regulator, anaerobic regulatory protein